MLIVTPISAFHDNYIWAVHDDRFAVLVDPGEALPCFGFLEKRGLDLLAILATHHHGDHVDGIPDLADRYHPRVFGPAGENIPGLTEPVTAGDVINIAELGLRLDVIGTPGHTLGHVSYHDGSRLFCGDTLFACGCGRLFEGTPAMMLSSLERLAQLPENTQIFCAHEYTISNISFAKTVDNCNKKLLEREQAELGRRHAGQPTLPSSLGLEKATNPFLRCREPALIEAAQLLLKRPPADAVEVFAALRRAKDGYQG